MSITQQCLGLSDEGIWDAIHDIGSVLNFAEVDLTQESTPDATTLFTFRKLLEEGRLTFRVFDESKAHLACNGLSMREGSIVDTTLIAVPLSTKNKDGQRDLDGVKRIDLQIRVGGDGKGKLMNAFAGKTLITVTQATEAV